MLFVALNRLDLIQELENQVDGVELRLDLFSEYSIDLVKEILNSTKCSVMLTLRNRFHGGKYAGSEPEREEAIERLLELHPPYFDLEYDMRGDFLRKILPKYPKTRFILSYHNFEEAPRNLEEVYHSMARYSAYGYKIAAMPQSTNDALRMLLFAKNTPKVSVICMGEKGEFARVLGPVVGNLIDYASSRNETIAPGQLSVSDLMKIYRYSSLNKETALYGLIGDPVYKSRGHLHHNLIFNQRKMNAVYVKMIVQPDELASFFPLAKAIGFRGLSVTMPLKEQVLGFLDTIDPQAKKIGAVNTLLIEKGKIFGTNTDGIGALDAIEKQQKVKNKHLVLLGAGGAARAIAFEAQHRGAHVLILNRTVDRAKELATAVGCDWGKLEEMPNRYDVLVNSTPECPIDPSKINPDALVMDIVWSSKETLFLQEAIRLGCRVVYGEEMFLNQAAAQTKLWTYHYG